MYKIYLKQAWALLKENKLLSGVSIFGTALAICMIMVIVIVWQMRTANYYGDVWLPYTTDNSLYDDSSDRLIGGFRCYILASSSADFDAIHSEAEANIARLNESQSTHLLKIGGGPDTHLSDLARRTLL